MTYTRRHFLGSTGLPDNLLKLILGHGQRLQAGSDVLLLELLHRDIRLDATALENATITQRNLQLTILGIDLGDKLVKVWPLEVVVEVSKE
jgi:hypothetical protein